MNRFDYRWIPLACLICLTAACSSSDDDDGPDAVADTPTNPDQANSPTDEPDQASPTDDGGNAGADGVRTVSIDATAGGFGTPADDPANKWSYFSFETGEVVALSDAAADSSTDWHIAFKRVAVKLNGGVSGPGKVRGGIADAQLEFYDENGEPDVERFTGATAEQELAAFSADVNVDEIDFEADTQVASIVSDGLSEDESWWLYNAADNTVNANPAVWYAVQGADGGSYAKLHVTDIQHADRQISIELFIQGPGETTFGTEPVVWTAAIGSEGVSLCFDFDTLGEVDCDSASADWDLQAEVSGGGRAWQLWTNGELRGEGTAGSSFGPLTNASQAGFASANSIPIWNEDAEGGIFSTQSWYAYNLQENNQIWPNYRVYAIADGETARWKAQILSYYDANGSSGIFTLRFEPLP